MSLGCLLAWLVLMPIAAVGGALALLCAGLAEFAQTLFGSRDQPLDPSIAHAIAMKICFGSESAPLSQRAR